MTRECAFCAEEHPVYRLERGLGASAALWFCRDALECCRVRNAKRDAEREAGQ